MLTKEAPLKYKKSSWVHLFENNREYALLNADNLYVFFTDKELFSFLKEYGQPKTKREIQTAAKIDRDTILTLIKHGFLIPEDSDEKKLFVEKINKIRESYLDPDSKATSLNAMRIIMTEKCNLNCKYCFVNYQRGLHTPKDLSRENLFYAVDYLIQHNQGRKISLQFFGGEPILKYPLIVDCIEYVSTKLEMGLLSEADFSITTNGTLLTDEICEYFKKRDVQVNISIDGPQEIHDQCRIYRDNKGTFTDTQKGFDLLKKHGNRIGVLITPTPVSLPHLAASYEYIVNHLGCKDVTLNTPQAIDGKWDVEPVALSNQVKQCLLIGGKYNTRFHSPATRVLIGLNSRKPQILSCARMGNDDEVTLSPDGKISYCIITWYVNECLDDLKNFKISSRFKEWKYYSSYNIEECFKCPLINLCGGPCAMEKYYQKKTGKYDIDRCIFYKDFIQWAIWN